MEVQVQIGPAQARAVFPMTSKRLTPKPPITPPPGRLLERPYPVAVSKQTVARPAFEVVGKVQDRPQPEAADDEVRGEAEHVPAASSGSATRSDKRARHS